MVIIFSNNKVRHYPIIKAITCSHYDEKKWGNCLTRCIFFRIKEKKSMLPCVHMKKKIIK